VSLPVGREESGGLDSFLASPDGNFASDDNPKKATARRMIQMTARINSEFPDRKMLVTCYTCHRGEAEPRTAPEAKAGL